MKNVIKFCVVISILAFTSSCRDTNKEEAETNAAIEKIEAVEAEAKEISEKIETEAEELEESLKELDSI